MACSFLWPAPFATWRKHIGFWLGQTTRSKRHRNGIEILRGGISELGQIHGFPWVKPGLVVSQIMASQPTLM